MRYIENMELREWVKENLRKAIFHKAHALAVQTGCEILVKLQDDVSEAVTPRNCYYATDKLGGIYSNKGVHKQSDEVAISGVTGLPVVSMMDRGIQSKEAGTNEACTEPITNDVLSKSSDDDLTVVKESSTTTDSPDANTTQEGGGTESDSDEDTPVPMQLSLTCTNEADSITDRLSGSDTNGQQNIKQETTKDDDDVRIKVEVIDDDDDDNDLIQMASEHVDDMDSSNTLQQTYQVEDSVQPNYPVPMSPKPYQCGMCQKAFRSIQVLQKHTQTFHQRAQHVVTARSRGRGYGSGMMKQRQQQFQVPSSASDQHRFPCMMCSRSFRHPALLDDHMNRSHMSHPSILQQANATAATPTTFVSTADAQKSVLESQLIQSLQNPSPDNSSDDIITLSDPSLPKITSVASLQQIIPDSSPGSLTAASTSSAPFTQGSPMSPVYRFQGPGPSTSAGPSSSQSRTPNRTGVQGVRLYSELIHEQVAWTDISGSGHRIREMSVGVTKGGILRLQEKHCQHCRIKDSRSRVMTSYECIVCKVAVCKDCFATHMSEEIQKLDHNIQKMGFSVTSYGRRQKRKDCFHCSCKAGNRRKQTPFECIVCNVGVCLDCREIHCSSIRIRQLQL